MGGMKQSRMMSLIEVVLQRAGMLFVISPLMALWWLPFNGLGVRGYWDGVWLSWPFVAVAVAYGYVVRRWFNR